MTDVVRIFIILAITFVAAILATPVLTYFLYKYKLGKQIRNDGGTPIFSTLHQKKAGTPTMGGLLIWITVAVLMAVFWLGDRYLNISLFSDLNRLRRLLIAPPKVNVLSIYRIFIFFIRAGHC